jgi:NitT/TauT family transport system permease protein
MALFLFHTRNVTNALKAQAPFGVDLLILAGILGIAAGALVFGERLVAPVADKVDISLSYWALPKYVLFTAMRGIAAYILSLAFTLVYGTTTAHSPKAERVMMPILDILQSIPVLSFLPGAVLLLISLFPHSELGLELSCILMIFTGQAWNMAFSYHGSLKGIPTALREVAALNNYTFWQKVVRLEIPSAMIGLIWNSMMSMAGGWFFLTTVEAFQLKDRDFRLPGLGSYMAEASQHLIDTHQPGPLIAGSVAMILMIVVFDQVLWRPLVVWAQKFKVEESSDVQTAQSWLLSLFAHSRMLVWLGRVFKSDRPRLNVPPKYRRFTPKAVLKYAPAKQWLGAALRVALLFALIVAGVYGVVELVLLVIRVPVWEPKAHEDWITIILALAASFARTSSAVAVGAAWALPAGIIIGRSAKLSNFFQPIIQTAASYPAPMVFPIVTAFLLAMHIPFNIACAALLLLGAQWYVLFNVIAGAMAIPADFKEVSVAYNMSQWQRWTKLYLPCVFPSLVTGLITAMGGAWNATIVAEYLTLGTGDTKVAFGLGAIIAEASNDTKYPLLAASTVTMAIFVVLLNRFFWKHLYRLAENRYALNN